MAGASLSEGIAAAPSGLIAVILIFTFLPLVIYLLKGLMEKEPA